MPEIDAPKQADVQVISRIFPSYHSYFPRFYNLLTLIKPADRPDLPILYMLEPQFTGQRQDGHRVDNRHKHGPRVMLHRDVARPVVRSLVIIIECHIMNKHKMLDDVCAVLLAEMELVWFEDVNREV